MQHFDSVISCSRNTIATRPKPIKKTKKDKKKGNIYAGFPNSRIIFCNVFLSSE